MQKIHPFLWFDTQAEDAMNFYCSVFKNAKPGKVSRYPEGTPGMAGKVMTAEMLEDLQSSHADGSFKRALRRYVKPDVLLLDEFAYDPLGADATKYLFRVVAARHHQGSIVLTANTGFEDWKKLFPSESAAVATVDRLVDNATILRFTGKSSRQPKEICGAPLDS